MSRIYKEQVYAVMERRIIDGEVRLFRTSARIYFSDKEALLGTVFMSNPGSFKMDQHSDWLEFHGGRGAIDKIQGFSKPDPTMQNIISAVRDAYQLLGKKADGYVAIYNLSTLVEPKGENIVGLHAKVEAALGAFDLNLLKEMPCHNREAFDEQCRLSSFVIMGFLRSAFPEYAATLKKWADNHLSKLVFTEDHHGCLVHPYRWRLSSVFRQQIRERLAAVLQFGDSKGYFQ